MDEVMTVSVDEGRKLQKKFFSVVTAVYNSAPWLECYFSSLLEQSIGFEEHIQVILVDDGSMDESWVIISEYARKYPNNIICIRKENGGQASARNLGIKYVDADWVCFIDSDDFVDMNYFSTVKKFIINDKFDGSLVSCKTVFFHEKNSFFDYSHVLSYRFDGKNVINLLKNSEFIQLSASTCFFKNSSIKYLNHEFSIDIRPSFEDAHFVNMYLLKTNNFKVAFLRNAVYFYRKRDIKSSTIDNSWRDEKKYSVELYYGCYDLLIQYEKAMGAIPEFVQNVVVYHIHWYCNVIYNNNFANNFSKKIVNLFFKIMAMIFKRVDVSTILYSKLPMLTLRSRALMLSKFKNYNEYVLPFIIVDLSNDKKEMFLLLYSAKCLSVKIKNKKNDNLIISNKIFKRVGYGAFLFFEQRICVNIDRQTSVSCEVDDIPVSILSRRKILNNPSHQDIISSYFYSVDEIEDERVDYMYLSTLNQYDKYDKCWLLMDRICKADDNAEHFYRWLNRNHPDKNKYFILSRNSKDWARLTEEGFSLVEYGSKEHSIALFRSEWLISSHADENVVDPLNTRNRYGVPSYKLAFLQHGVTKDDISSWLNKKNFDVFITCATSEYDSVINGNYKFTPKEVVLTGFPRHDTLIQKNKNLKKGEKFILLCPTWRKSLKYIDSVDGSRSELCDEIFLKSDFYKSWNAVLCDEEMSALINHHGYKIIFLPHPEVNPYIHLFCKSDSVFVMTYQDVNSVQDLILNSQIMITDYSSMAFEAAIIERPVVYYQFEEDPPIFDSHLYGKGYFIYNSDAFGPVLSNLHDVVQYVSQIIDNECKISSLYKDRINSFFSLRDGLSCRRVYDAIVARS